MRNGFLGYDMILFVFLSRLKFREASVIVKRELVWLGVAYLSTVSVAAFLFILFRSQ
jgi:hypothetical protein